MQLPQQEQLTVSTLGACRHSSPFKHLCAGPGADTRVLASAQTDDSEQCLKQGLPLPSFELAGPQRQIFFNPAELTCGIVTCGGICPGLNDVIRSITLTLKQGYGIKRVLGFRYGYNGLGADPYAEPCELTEELVKDVQETSGTMLGSSRGPQSVDTIIASLQKHKVSILFTVGGDGTLTGASTVAQELLRRKLPIAVIGVPKTIDNDLSWTIRSFGFSTAVEEAARAVVAAHTEARSAYNGIGLVKLMGRHSGFIAAHAALATGNVNFCLIPELPFGLEGQNGFLRVLEQRMDRKHHAVIVVAEGAGQDLQSSAETAPRDASGNVSLKDIGVFMKECIAEHFAKIGKPVTIKYIDPSYIIRSLPANSIDSEYCLVLGQHAVHAGMSGRTDMVVTRWNDHFIYAPIPLVVGQRKQIDPAGEIWQSVLSATHQPAEML